MSRLSKAALAGLVLILLNGCSQDTGPKYVAPQGRATDLAVLKGTWGTYVCEVDGAGVEGGAGIGIFGGSSVTVRPGTHSLMVVVDDAGGGGPAAPAKPGLSLQMTYNPDGDGVNRFSFVCEKGHTYEFSRRHLFTKKLKVTDKNTGRSMEIEDQGAQGG
jgi:hypothetical protein